MAALGGWCESHALDEHLAGCAVVFVERLAHRIILCRGRVQHVHTAV